MTVDQLRILVEQAAGEVVDRHGRPVPVTVVVPLEGSTKVLSLEAFPDDDADRKEALSVLAARQLAPANASCFGFLAEASAPQGAVSGGADLLVVVYGARRRGAWVMAAVLTADSDLGEFGEPEVLEPTAMPFLQPLQHAVDLAEPPSQPGQGEGGLPIIG